MNHVHAARPLAGRMAFCVLMLAGLWSPAQAQQIHVSPLQVSFVPGDRAEQIVLRNDSKEPVSMQARVFAWAQDPVGGMMLSPSTTITVAPPLMVLPPGGTQVVRVLRREALPADREHYFRLLIDELPSAEAASRSAVQMLTRYSLPVFVEPALAGRPKLSVRWLRCRSGLQWLQVDNAGQRRARLADWTLVSSQGAVLASHGGLAGYALANGSTPVALQVGVSASGEQVEWHVKTDAGDMRLPVLPPSEVDECPVTE